MTWVKLDDHYPDHPKLQALGDDYDQGLSLDIRGKCYAASNLTDGFIPARVFRHEQPIINRLVEVGLWHEVEGGFAIHDYLKFNPSRESVEKQRDDWRKRQDKSRKVSRRDTDGDTHCDSSLPVPPPVPPSLTPSPEPPTPQTPQGGGEAWTLRMNPSQITKLAKSFGDEQVRTAAIKLADDERQGLVTIKTSFHALLKHRLENPPAPERRMTPDGVPLDEL